MRRPPRNPRATLFSTERIWWGVIQGAVALGAVSATLVFAVWRGMPQDEVRALTYFALVILILGLIFVNRSYSASLRTALIRPNGVLALVVLSVAAMLAVTLAWPVTARLFQFGPLHADDLLIVLGMGVSMMLALEAMKWLGQTLRCNRE